MLLKYVLTEIHVFPALHKAQYAVFLDLCWENKADLIGGCLSQPSH